MNGNVHPDILRQGIPQPTMLSMGTPFMQNIPPSSQQQLASSHLGLPPSSNPSNSSMMLNSAPSHSNPSQQRYPMPMQQGDSRQQRPMQIRPGQPNQPMMGPSGGPMLGGAGGPHMVGMPHGQSMGFNADLIGQPPGNPTARRVSSQPQMGQVPVGMGSVASGVVNANMGMGMSPQGNMQQMRQMPQGMQQRMGMQGAHMPNQMSNMPIPVNRPGGNPNNMQGRNSSGPQQLMNSLNQPPSMPHPVGPHQNQFQNPVQIPSQLPPQIPSPRPGSHPPTHTPNMNMTTPGPSHTPVSRPPQLNPEDPMSFMNYPNSQYPQSQHTPRMSNGQFSPFVAPSSTPPIMGEMPQPMPTNMGTPGGTTGRPSFSITPAQAYDRMNPSPDNFSHFNMAPLSHASPRPPSQLNAHSLPQQPIPHHSPHSSESHIPSHSHPQRPQSQPQAMPRPSSQPSHTPRSAHPSLPSGAVPSRMSMPSLGPQGAPQMPMGASGVMPGSGPVPHNPSIAPRPPGQPPQGPPPLNVPPTNQGPSTPPSSSVSIPRPLNPEFNLPAQVGQGQGLIRLLQFSAVLAAENKTNKLQLSWWIDLIKEYFTPKAMLKFTLWKDNQRNEAKPFEIGVPILPRFFLVTTQSGVKSMSLSLDGARERMYTPGHSIVECVTAIWTYKYNNGYTVTLRGPLTAHVVVTASVPPNPSGTPPNSRNQQPPNVQLKFEDFQFDANYHDKYVALDSISGPRLVGPTTPHVRNAPTPMPNGTSPTSQQQQQQLEEDKKWEEPRVTIEMATIPGEPVNAFGIPQATMRCLELAESVSAMADLITFSADLGLGPLDALRQYALKLREIQPFNPPPNNGPLPNPNGPHIPGLFAPMYNNIPQPPMPASTLYSSAPPSITNPSGNNVPILSGSTVSPKNAPRSTSNSPQKQHKSIPQQTPGASSSGAPAASPAVSSGGTTNTPAMANASLKRKQGIETSSPTTVTVESAPSTKRVKGRRRTTNAGGGTGGG